MEKGTLIPDKYISLVGIEKRRYELTSDLKIGLIFHLNVNGKCFFRLQENNLFSNYLTHRLIDTAQRSTSNTIEVNN